MTEACAARGGSIVGPQKSLVAAGAELHAVSASTAKARRCIATVLPRRAPNHKLLGMAMTLQSKAVVEGGLHATRQENLLHGRLCLCDLCLKFGQLVRLGAPCAESRFSTVALFFQPAEVAGADTSTAAI